MRRMTAVLIVTAIALCCGSTLARAQETSGTAKPEKATSDESKPKADQRSKSIQPYRLDFSLNEIQEGKKINTRHYSMSLTGDGPNEIKIGTRVPVPTFESGGNPVQYQYMDLGINIWASLREVGDELQTQVRSESSWAKAPPENIDVDPKHEHSPNSPR
jgi:hypothetical protein